MTLIEITEPLSMNYLFLIQQQKLKIQITITQSLGMFLIERSEK